MSEYRTRILGALFAGTLFSLASISTVHAIDHDLTLYAWGAGINGTATLNNRALPNSPVEADFEDILEKLEMAFMGHYEGMGDTWGFGIDAVYIGLGDTNEAGITGDVDAGIAEGFAIYRASEVFDLLAGVRYTGLDLRVEMPGGSVGEENASLTDFFLGGRLSLPFSDSWQGAIRADAGAGGSDLTWNAIALLSWQASDAFALRGGYRWIQYEFEEEYSGVTAELDIGFDGPFLGIAFQW